MKYLIKRALIVCALLAAPVTALAAEGFATTNVNLRSGPSTAYPAVVVVPAGASLNVYGCLAETPWCDVSFGRIRGWMAGRYIQTVYRERRVYVGPDYYRSLGIPIIRFDLDNYWERNYRGRNFYRDRDRWRREFRRDFRGRDSGFERDRDNRPRWDRDRDNEPPRWDRDNNRQDGRRDDRQRDDRQRDDRQRDDWQRNGWQRDGQWNGGRADDSGSRDGQRRRDRNSDGQGWNDGGQGDGRADGDRRERRREGRERRWDGCSPDAPGCQQ